MLQGLRPVRVKTNRLILAGFQTGRQGIRRAYWQDGKTIALSVVVAIVVFVAIYAVTVLRTKPARR